MNQGHPPGRFEKDNGVYQDGALLFNFDRKIPRRNMHRTITARGKWRSNRQPRASKKGAPGTVKAGSPRRSHRRHPSRHRQVRQGPWTTPDRGLRWLPRSLGGQPGATLYLDIASGPFYGFNCPGAIISEGTIRNWWRQGLMGGANAHYESSRFSRRQISPRTCRSSTLRSW